MSSVLRTCTNSFDLKIISWFVCTDFGRPNEKKNFVMACAIDLAVVTQRHGFGKRVTAPTMVSRYWLPDFVLGSGPTQSAITCSNGSPTAGMGCNGASGMT